MKERICYICGTGETSKWYGHYKGHTKIYYCHKCELEDRRSSTKKIKEQRMKERICRVCGIGEIHALGMCQKCYIEEYNKRPDSNHNIIKMMSQCRTKIIDFDRFNDFNSNEIGSIGEYIVAKTLVLKNQNVISDNYNSPFDLTIHHIYGRIQVRTKCLDTKRGVWSCSFDNNELLWKEYDSLIILCMDEYSLWKNVTRVYIIPYEELEGLRGIAICKDAKSSKWEKFRIDEKMFDDIWNNLSLYLKNKRFFCLRDLEEWLMI